MPPPIIPKLPFLFLLFILLPLFEIAAITDLEILLNLKSSFGITNSTKGLESWSPENTPCSFTGVTCQEGSVTKIDLTDKGILGTIPFNYICQLRALTSLSMGSNNLTGKITQDIRSCTELRNLDLASNLLTGVVPDLSTLVNLKQLNLSDNRFSGKFPWSSLSGLQDLEYLSVGDNNKLDPSMFPMEVVNLTNLHWLYLSVCNLHGRIPPEIGKLTKLVNLELADNYFEGEIPQEITMLKNLWQLELYNNFLTGELPEGMGRLSNLEYFDASENHLEGNLSQLRGLNKLVSLQLFTNNFSGEVPVEFGEFRQLVNISLYVNKLTGELPQKLGSWAEFDYIDVSTNYLTGSIPPDMCKKGTMRRLLMIENNFTGEIPASYANCSKLIRFRVSNNSLSGNVPPGIWGLPNAELIDLANNQLEGLISPEIGKAKSLNYLLVANNKFSGMIPQEISGASNLGTFDASLNQFTGQIPASTGELKQLENLILEGNSFSGPIPDTVGSCARLTTLNLARNSLNGSIPASLGSIPILNSMNLSDNQLSGEIPESLTALKLSLLDFSNNRLTGEVPSALSIDAYSNSFMGNPGLCADSSRILPRCSLSGGGSSSDKLRVAIAAVLIGSALVMAFVGVFLFIKKRKLEEQDKWRRRSWDLKSFRLLSFDEQEIINSVKQENLIGKGGSGNVYRVELASGKVVAVKHLWNYRNSNNRRQQETAAILGEKMANSKEFKAEVGTLSSIRHVNVVKLYSAITSEDASLLVYEYLPNGSLWESLHGDEGEKKRLGWEERVEVARGAAKGLEYLHHGCDRPILHRDVKSSNILLDEELKPRIADFGLAKILHAHAGAGRESSAHVVAGTHGYIAPEYAYTWKVNEKSDVYSFGVVLMELVTGRRPIEPEYGENKDIVYWVSGSVTSRDRVVALIDARIPEYYHEDAVRMLRIAVLCTNYLPTMRPPMRTVVQMLEELKVGHFISICDAKKIDTGDFTIEVKESNQKLKGSPGS